MAKKTIIFFIDGATWDILNPWIESGELPALRKIKEGAAFGDLKSVIPTTTNIATPSFYFGKDPSYLKTFHLSDSDSFLINSETFGGYRALWHILSLNGYKSLIFNFPFTYPAKKINGVLFSGFFTPQNKNDFVYPENLAEKYPDYPRGGFEFIEKSFHDKKTLIEKEMAATEKRFNIFLKELSAGSFDFTAFYVCATDIIQHFFWNEKDKLLKFYKFLDFLMAKLIGLGYFDNFLIISDHGFAAAPKSTFFINTWLEKEGLLVWKKSSKGTGARWVRKILEQNRFFSKLYYQTRYFTSRYFKNNKTKDVKEEKGQIIVSGAIDKEKSLAYAVGGVLHGRGIFINKNFVKTGEEQEKILYKIKNRLSELKFAGQPAIKLIKKRDEIYSFPKKDTLPDLIFLSDEGLFVDDKFSKDIFSKRKTKSQASGHHMSSINGIFIWNGKEIKPGRYDNFSLLDIFPTILHLYGCALPADTSGRALLEIWQDGSSFKNRKLQFEKREELLDEINY